MTDVSRIKSLPDGSMVMLRGSRKKAMRFTPKSLSLAVASAYQAASSSISQAITGLSITLAGLAHAQAQNSHLPQGGVAVHGSATFQQNGTTLNVNTSNGAGTNNSIINWQSFNIGAGHTTNINQPNANSSSLNRVITNTPSQIYGTLRSNGNVILVNQNGIAVGAGGVVDTAGFTASTLNISDADAKAGKLRFQGNALSGGVQIDGVIRSSNGDILLFAPNVAVGKDGLVKADNGNVIVGAGQSVEVTGRGLEGVKFIIQGADNKAINLGTLQGNAVGVFAGTLRHSGVIQAQSATMEGGRVVLRAIKDVEIVRDPSLANAPKIIADGGVNAQGVAQSGGNIQIQSTQGNVTIGAGSTITANAGNSGQNSPIAGMNAAGGAINIEATLGRVITEAGSQISATGHPGGTIRIYGGQEARIASAINASSPSRGAPDAAGTLVLLTAQDVGGRIEVLSPQTVNLDIGAQLLASGDSGGGTILVGGDYQGANASITNAHDTNVSADVLLEANARVNGNGGKVIVWANNDTYFGGSIKATGGEQGGDGGFGETSGKKHLYFRGRADLSARRGRTGTLLLDPENILIEGGAGGANDGEVSDNVVNAGDGSGNFTISEAALEALTGNVVLEATSYIAFSGGFGTNGSLAAGLHMAGDFTLRTRNQIGDPDSGPVGIYLGGWGNSIFNLSAAGNISVLAGSNFTTGTLTPGISSNPGSLFTMQSGSGNILLESAGLLSLGSGANLLASNGNVTLRSKLGNVSLSEPASAGAHISAKTILLEAQAFDGLVALRGSSSLNATNTGTAITLRGDRLEMESTAIVVATNGAIEVRPWTGSRTILLGGGNDNTGQGNLQISQDEFNNFSAALGTVRIGDTDAMSGAFTGDINIGGGSAFAFGFNPVALLTTGGIIGQSQSFSADKIRLRGGTISLNTSGNLINQLTAQSTNSANLFELNLGSTISFVTAVDGQSGVHSAAAVNIINTNIAASNLYLDAGNITAEGIINIAGYENFSIYGNNFVIDSNNDNSGSAGNIVLGNAVIQGNSTGSLTLNSSAPTGVAGAINFGNVQLDTLANALGSLIVNSSGTAVGQITLPSTITVGLNSLSINGRAILNQDVSLSTINNGQVILQGEVQGNHDLTINANGQVALQGEIGTGTALNDIFITSANVISLSNRIKADGNLSIVANTSGILNMNSAAEIDMVGTGSPGSQSIYLFGQGSAQLGKISSTNAYNATISVGSAGAAITTASNAVTNVAGTNALTLGSAGARANIGTSGAPIKLNAAGDITAFGATSLYLTSPSAVNSLSIASASVDTGTTATANIQATTNNALTLGTVSVLGTGTAHLDFQSLGQLVVLNSITGITGGGAKSDAVLGSDDSILLLGSAGTIFNLDYVNLRGSSAGEKIRFVDSVSVPSVGEMQMAYGITSKVDSTVGHVVIGNPNLTGGAIVFDEAGSFATNALVARNYSFFSGGDISSTFGRNMDLAQAGFSANGNIALGNVSIQNSEASTSLVLAANAAGSVGSVDLLVSDVDGVLISTVGQSKLPVGAWLSDVKTTGSGNVSLTSTAGGVRSSGTNFALSAGAGTVSVVANGDIGSVVTPFTLRGSKFTLQTTGGGVNQIAVAATRNSSSTVKTSDLTFDTGNQAGDSIYLINGVGTSTLQIDDGFGTGSSINRTLNNTGGNIRITAPNVELSGSGSLRLKASGGTTFESIATISSGHTVTIDGVQNATVSATTGWLQGEGTLAFTNAGSTLIVNGTISPGSGSALGKLTVNGNLTMGSMGVLDLQIGTTVTNGDRIAVTDTLNATVGTLRISESAPALTEVGTAYTLGTATNFAGGFSTIEKSTGNFDVTLGSGALTATPVSLTNKWITSAGGSWGTAGLNTNWSRGITPTAAHDVWVDMASFNPIVTVGSAAVANSLHVGDTLTLNASLGLTGGMAVLNGGTFNHTNGSSGTITAGGNITIDAGGVMNWAGGQIGLATDTSQLFTTNGLLNISGPGSSNQSIYRSWNNTGVVNWTGGRSTSLVNNANGAVLFTNDASGQINLNSTFTGTDNFIDGGGGNVDNLGVITSNSTSGTLVTGITRPFRNGGSVTVSAGTLSIGGAGTLNADTGSYSVASGAGLSLGGVRQMNASVAITGAGALSLVSPSTLTINGGANLGLFSTGKLSLLGQLNLNTGLTHNIADLSIGTGGVINTSDTVNITALTASGGTFNGTGSFSITGASAITGTLSRDGGTWSNSGIMSVSATGGLRLTNNATLSNTPGGQINYVGAGSDAVVSGIGSNRFINQGTVSLGVGTSSRDMTVFFDNSGVVNISAGQLVLSNTSNGTESGTYNVASGSTLLINGTRNFTSLSAGAGLFGTGLLDVQSSGVVTLSSGVGTGLLQNGTLKLASGRLTLNTGSGFTFANTVQLLGSSTLSHANAVTGAFTATGAGLITSPSAGTVWTLPTLTTSTLSMGAGTFSTTNSVLENFGTLNFSGNGTLSLGNSFTNQGIVNLTGEGTMSGVGTFNNTSAGTLNRSISANTFNINSGFAQGGTINANSGTLAFANAFTNSRLIQGTARINVGGAGLTNGAAGTIAPGGVGAVGTLTISGSLTMVSGSKLLVDASSAATYDKLNVTGDVNSAAGATISVSEATPFLVVNDQLDALAYTGTFSGALPTVVSPAGVTLTRTTTAPSNGLLRLTTSAISNFWLDAYVDKNYINNANWSRGHTPTLTEDAIINPSAAGVNVTLASGSQAPRSLQLTGDDFLTVNGGTLTLAQTSTVASSAGLFLSSGQINGAGDLNIAGGFTWSNGSIEGTGKLRTASGVTSTLASSGSRFLRREWENQGTINLSTGYLQVYDSNGTLTNQSSGVMNVTSTYSPDPLAAFNAGAQINNEGTINWNTGIANTLSGPFSNKSGGVVNVQGTSQLNLTGDGTDAGIYSISNASAGLIFSGTRSLSAGSNIAGAGTFTTNGGASTLSGALGIAGTGTVRVTGGTLTLNTSSPTLSFVNALIVTGGVLTGSNSFNANGGLNWSGGSIEGSGTLFTASGVTSSLGGGAGRILRRSWNNEGTINLGGSAYLHVDGNFGTLTNKGGGIFNVTSSYNPDPLAAFNAGAQINNEGTINWNTGNANTLSGPFSNKSGGVVNVQGTSQLSLAGDGTDAGSYSIGNAAGLIFASGTRSLTSSSNITGAGTFTNNGGTTTLAGALGIAGAGTVQVANGTLTLNTSSPTLNFANALIVTGGVLTGSNSFNANGGLNWSGGSIEGTGTQFTASGVISSLGGGAGRVLRRSWSNEGTINLGGSAYLHVDGGSTTLSNLSGGTLNVTSSYAIDPLAGTNGAVINNQGELVWNTGLSQNFSGTLSNQSGGKISITGSSSLDLSSTTFAQNTGATIDIGSGSTLKRQVVGLTNNGLITGAGTIDVTGATLINAAGGTIAPGGTGIAATLSIAGSADLAAGILLFDLDTAALYDRIAVTGNLTLGSAPLVLSDLSGNYTAGDNFNLITYGGTVSGFAPTLNTTAITDVTFVASTSAASGGSVIASTSSVINRWLDGITGSWQTASNWSRGHVPTLTEDVVIAPTGTQTVLLSVGTGKARSLTISGDDTLSIADTTTLQLGSGSSTIGAGTTLTMDNSHIQGGVGSSIINQGTISGTGTITVGSGTGTLTNANGGTLLPGDVNGFVDVGTLTINGNLQLDSNSKISFDLNKTDSDKIVVSGDINLVGVSNAPNILFTEFNGPSFTGLEAAQTVMTSGGNFNGLPTQYAWANGSSDIDFEANANFAGKALTAQVVNIKNYWITSTPSGGDWFNSSNWSRNSTPNQIHNVYIDQPSANLVTITSGAANARTLILGDGIGANTLAISGSGASLTVNNSTSKTSTLVDVFSGSTLSLSGGASLALGAGTMYVDSGAMLQLNFGTVSVFGGSQGNAYLNNQGLILSDGSSVLGQAAGGKEIILENLNSPSIGTIEVASGELQIQSNSFTQMGLLKVNTSTSTLSYLGGTLDNDGTISGGGIIKINNGSGTLQNDGTIAPGTAATIDTLQVIGDFNNTASGTLRILADAVNSNSQLDVSGAVNLAGTLSVGTIGAHAFAGGQMYDIITGATSVNGSFGQIIGQGAYLVTVSGSNPLSMSFSLGAGAIEWIGTDGDWNVASNWKDSNNINRVPISGDTVIINPAGAHTVTLGTLSVSGLNGLTMADLGAGADTLFIAAGGVLTLPTSNNTLNGLLVVGGGSLTVPADVSMASLNYQSGALTVNAGSTLTLTKDSTFLANVTGTGTIANATGATSHLIGVNVAPSLVNNGTLIISNKVIASSLSLASGSLNLNNGTLVHSAGDLINSPGAAIIGSGTIDVGAGKLINQSSIQPGGYTTLGTISILGGADLSAGFIDFELMSTSSYDQFTATGAVVLGGSVRLIENGSFIGSGDSFSGLITAGSLSGTLPTFTLFDTSLNTITEVTMSVSKSGGNFSADVSAVTNNWASSTGGQWNTASNWSRGHAPRSGEDAVIDPVGSQVVTLSGGSGAAKSISMPGSNGADSLKIDGTDLTVGTSLTTVGYLLMEGSVTQAMISVGDDIHVANLNVNGFATVQAGQTIYSQGGTFTGTSSTVTIDAQRWENTAGTLNMNISSGTIDLVGTDVVNHFGSMVDLNGAGTGIAIVGSGIFENAGVLNNNLANNTISLELDNTIGGVINVNAGSLTADSATGFTNNGELNTAANTSFLTGNTAFLNNGLATGLGTINVGSSNFTNTSTGVLNPGASGGAGIGALTIAGNANLSSGAAELEMVNGSSYDSLHVTQALTVSPGLNLNINGTGLSLAGGENFNLLSYGGTASGAFPTVVNNISGKSFTLTQPSAFGSSFVLQNAGFVTNIFWDSGGDGTSWADPLNWSTDLLPVAGQNVTLDSLSNTVTIATGTDVSGLIGFNLDATDALFITGGSLALPGSNLNLNGAVNLAGGTLVGDTAGGSFTGGLNWSSGKFGGAGTYSSASLSLTGGGIRTLDGATLVSSSASGSTLNNGSLLLNSGQYSTGSLGFLVTGAGTLAFAGGALSSNGVTNDGILRVDSGSVALNNTAIQTGAFSIASGANLSFQNNVSLGSSASILGGNWTIDSGKTVITSAALNRGAGGTTFIKGALQMGGDFETEQLIFLSGGSIAGGNKALSVTQQWNDSAIGAGSVTGLSSATITQATGNLQFNKSLAVTGNVSLTATSGNITGGTNAITAGQRLEANASGLIDLDVQAATLAAASAGGNIVLDISGPTLMGSLSTAAGKTATLNTTGNLGQNGIINTAGHIDLNLAGNTVSWLNTGNVFGQGVHVNSGNRVQLSSNAANLMSISGSMATLEAGGGSMQLGDSYGALSVSGPLTVNATGNISQGAALNITGLADLTGQSITLSTASTYGGGVQFAASGSVLLNATGALDIRGSTPGSLSLTATGNITQSGTLNVGGAASLTATGKNIILNNAGNNFLSVHAVADQINLTDADTSNNGLAISGTLGTIASYVVGGNLTSNGLLTSSVLNVNNSTAGRSVNLGSLNVSNLVSFNTSAGAYTDISYNNAGIAQLGAPIVVTGNVSITTAGGLTLPSVTASSFTLNANGAIGQVNGSSIYAPISNINTTSGFDISLTEVANVLESFSSSGRDISVVSSKTLNPQISSSRNVSLNAPDIVQSAGHAIQSSSLAANATGGIDLLGSNNVGSFAATTAGGIALNNPGGPLVLDQINAPAGISINASAALTQVSGKTLSASQVQLQAGSIGSSSSPVVVDAPLVRASATAGDAYLSNPQSSELRGLQAAGTASYVSNLDIEVTGNVAATNVVLQAGADLDIGNLASPVSIKASNSVSLQGANISLMGGAAAGASATVQSEGSVSINSAGTFVIEGGSQSGTQAQVKALGAVNVLVAGTLSVIGGTGDGSYALLDPAAGVPMTITANAINLTGGAGQGAYAAIASDGDITLNAPSLSMTLGTGADADAVVVSNFGRITAPGNCNGCVDLNLFPLGNGASNTGLYEGARIIGQSNSTNLLSTQLSQIAVVLDDAQRDPEERRDPEPDIVVEGQNCP